MLPELLFYLIDWLRHTAGIVVLVEGHFEISIVWTEHCFQASSYVSLEIRFDADMNREILGRSDGRFFAAILKKTIISLRSLRVHGDLMIDYVPPEKTVIATCIRD
jgi:hypothetical protein